MNKVPNVIKKWRVINAYRLLPIVILLNNANTYVIAVILLLIIFYISIVNIFVLNSWCKWLTFYKRFEVVIFCLFN